MKNILLTFGGDFCLVTYGYAIATVTQPAPSHNLIKQTNRKQRHDARNGKAVKPVGF